MSTYEKDLAVTLDTLTRRIRQFEPEVRSTLRGIYLLHLQESRGQSRRLYISITEESAFLTEDMPGPEDLQIELRGSDLVTLVAGATDPLTLFTNDRLVIRDGHGQIVSFAQGRRLLQTLLVEWRIDSRAIAAIDAHGAVAEERATIDRVAKLEPGAFLERYASCGTPVVLSGALSGWKLSRMTPDMLCEQMGDYEIAVFSSMGKDESPGDGKQGKPVSAVGRVFSKTRFGDFIEKHFYGQRRIEDLTRSAPYITAHSIPERLLELIEYPPFFDRKAFVRPKMWAGPAGTLTPLHRDLVDNFLAQVWGFKHLRLISPIETKNMYPEPEGLNPYYEPSKLNADSPDLARYPDCAGVPYVDCVLGPGDMLYSPAGWWHQVRSLEPSLSINFFALNQQPMRLANAVQHDEA